MQVERFPVDITYTGTHSWLALAPGEVVFDRPVRSGITPLAVAGRDVVSVALPPVRCRVAAGEVCGIVRCADTSVIEIHAPISGIVTIHNVDAVADPKVLEEDPFRSGWLFAILPAADATRIELLTQARYAADALAQV